MIIACPKCERRFGVQDDLIPPSGRRARCASCGEVFHAMPAPPTPAGEQIHFQTVPLPGDGLATSPSFVAPAAPPSILAHRRGGPYAIPGLRSDGPPVLSSMTPRPAPPVAERAAEPEAAAPVPVKEEPLPLARQAAVEPTPAPAQAREPLPSYPEPALDPTKGILPSLTDALRHSGEHDPEGTRWLARDALGRQVPCDAKDLAAMIRSGILLADDRVWEQGSGRAVRAGDLHELKWHFSLRDAAESPGERPLHGAEPMRGARRRGGLAGAAAVTGGIVLLAAATAGPVTLYTLPLETSRTIQFGVGVATGGAFAAGVSLLLSRRSARN